MQRLLVRLIAAGMVAIGLSGCGGVIYATIKNDLGDDVMLLGHDPVAYFTLGKPVRGDPRYKVALQHRTYYFANAEHQSLFAANPAKYEPQHGGFCSNGTPYKIKLGSDPTEWEIVDGRLFIFGDIVGHSLWKLHMRENIANADRVWDEIKDIPHRATTARAWTAGRVPWYRTHKELMAQWDAQYPDKPIKYDPGGVVRNLVFKYPGWRAREGFGQPALGVVGLDPCPPACPGTEPIGYDPGWKR
jgi:YHS domain-containing protein